MLTEHSEQSIHISLVFLQIGNAVKQGTDKKVLLCLLPKYFEKNFTDYLAILSPNLSFRHTDQNKIQFIAAVNQSLVDLWQNDSNIIDDQSH